MENNISDAEWEVMRVIWSNKSTTSKNVIEILSNKKGWSSSTIKTLLGRLVEKKLLETFKQGNKFIYKSLVDEENCLEILTKNFLNKFCARKTYNISKCIINENRLSKKEIEELINLLNNKKLNAPVEVKCNCVQGQCSCNHSCKCENHKI